MKIKKLKMTYSKYFVKNKRKKLINKTNKLNSLVPTDKKKSDMKGIR